MKLGLLAKFLADFASWLRKYLHKVVVTASV